MDVEVSVPATAAAPITLCKGAAAGEVLAAGDPAVHAEALRLLDFGGQ